MINSKFLKIMLLIFILFSAIAGQIQYAFYKAELKGSIYYLISFINIILLYALLRKKGAENTNKTIEDITENAKKPELHKNPLFAHPALKIISFTLFVIILYQAYSLTDNIISILIWLCMLFLFILSFLKIKLYDIPNKLKNIIYNIKTRDAVLFFIILITAIVFRVYNLEKIPLEVNQEEGFASVGALEVLSGVLKGPFDFGPKSAPGWTYYSGLYYYGHAFFIKIFGNSIIGNRMFAAIAGILCVPVTMLFTKEAAGKKTAYLAGFLVAVFGVHIHFSRFGFMFIHSALWGYTGTVYDTCI
jgi:4-amino-4-deoxy-L-arabinose transferase-like glycosyltransferase